jgi:hypothetical protein
VFGCLPPCMSQSVLNQTDQLAATSRLLKGPRIYWWQDATLHCALGDHWDPS